ncbi:MAG: hypothetical protein Q7J04_01105, partial [Microcella sp.]|nr:hypothetical protein [Microcella sp.]
APADSEAPLLVPSELPVEAPSDDMLEAIEEPGEQTYPRTWPLDAWAPVAVRQAGATVCAFAFDLPSGTTTVMLTLFADLGPKLSSSLSCSSSGVGVVPTQCRGAVGVGNGFATLDYELPFDADIAEGRVEAQAILQAAQRELEYPAGLRPPPSTNRAAMSSSPAPCDPSAEQKAAVFSQVDVYDGITDVYRASNAINFVGTVTHDRIAVKGCAWYFGWQSASISIVPWGGWAAGEPGVVGTPVDVLGADAALRTETPYLDYSTGDERDMVEVTLITSARGSVVFVTMQVLPGQLPYWRERLVGITEAIVGTEP